MDNRKAFVAGATGYTGREVVRELRARGVTTLAHVRPDSSRLAEWTERFEALGARVDSTAWEEEAMRATLSRERPDLVFALLGTTRARQAREAKQGVDPAANSYEQVDYGMTAMLLRAAAASGRPRFVYLSSWGAEGGRGAYLDARRRIEAELAASELPFVIARPGFISGPDREESRRGERWGAAISDGLLSVVSRLGGRRSADRFRTISGAELARGLVRLALDPGAEGRVAFSDELRRP